MVYQPTKPQPNDNLDVSVTDIQQNFLTANTVMNINHYPFDDATANKGKHKAVVIPIPVPTPKPVLSANEAALYTDMATQTQLFFTSDNGPTGNQTYQMTRAVDAAIATFGTSTNYPPNIIGVPVTNQTGGWTFLPGGILLQYGRMNSTGGSTAVTFPIDFTTQVFSIQATRVQNSGSDAAWGINGLTISGFNFNSNSSTVGVTFYWVAIGV